MYINVLYFLAPGGKMLTGHEINYINSAGDNDSN